MSEAEVMFRYKLFGGSARNVMDTGSTLDSEHLEIVEKSMCWMFGEHMKSDHPDWWNVILEKTSENLTQVDDEMHPSGMGVAFESLGHRRINADFDLKTDYGLRMP